MRTLLILLMSMVASPSAAQYQSDFKRLADALFAHMATTYMCRIELGGLSHYQAARTIAVGAAGQLMGQNEAVKMVEAMDKKLRNDPRGDSPDFGPHGRQACLEMVNDGLFEIEAAKASAGID